VQVIEELGRRAFRHQTFARFRGIIAHLTKLGGGNAHGRGLVNLTSSSVLSGEPRVPNSSTDTSNSDSFASDHLPDQWICFDFKICRVLLITRFGVSMLMLVTGVNLFEDHAMIS
jgi:hypothetical protein